jgi:hypothetical protein
MLLLLRQHRLSHLYVHLLKENKDCVFPQCSVEIGELLGHGTRGACLGEEILLNRLARTQLATRSAHPSPSTRVNTSNPSSHAMTTPPRLSSSISRARSYPSSSTTTTCEGHITLCQSSSKNQHHDKGACPGKCQHRVETHLDGGDARLEEASVPTRQDGG